MRNKATWRPRSRRPCAFFTAWEAGCSCPLTVREGRRWLSEELKDTKIRRDSLPDPGETEEPEAKDAAVALKEVWFRYEKDAPDVLRGTSLSVPKGTLFAVVGGNGTGKSTMLKTVCGICRPYRGKVMIDGKRIEKYKAEELFRGNLAMLPQDPQSLFVKKTVEEDLVEMLADVPGSIGEKRSSSTGWRGTVR